MDILSEKKVEHELAPEKYVFVLTYSIVEWKMDAVS
jgi:hypothetical protein